MYIIISLCFISYCLLQCKVVSILYSLSLSLSLSLATHLSTPRYVQSSLNILNAQPHTVTTSLSDYPNKFDWLVQFC